ncbi:MAG: hypothetical protein ACXV2C_03910 [Candidatus Bathyarchaeia archaeon]
MPFVDSDIDDFSDVEIIEELQERGYEVWPEDAEYLLDRETKQDIEKLYLDYQLTSPEFFTKQLKKFFTKYLDKTFI